MDRRSRWIGVAPTFHSGEASARVKTSLRRFAVLTRTERFLDMHLSERRDRLALADGPPSRTELIEPAGLTFPSKAKTEGPDVDCAGRRQGDGQVAQLHLKNGHHVMLTCRDNAMGEHQTVTGIKLAKGKAYAHVLDARPRRGRPPTSFESRPCLVLG